jgi:hypothetical protein
MVLFGGKVISSILVSTLYVGDMMENYDDEPGYGEGLFCRV